MSRYAALATNLISIIGQGVILMLCMSLFSTIQAVVYQSEKLIERMGTSDYRVIVVIDRRGANVFSQDLELYKAFFKVGEREGVLRCGLYSSSLSCTDTHPMFFFVAFCVSASFVHDRRLQNSIQ